jgi:hypothetical protein
MKVTGQLERHRSSRCPQGTPKASVNSRPWVLSKLRSIILGEVQAGQRSLSYLRGVLQASATGYAVFFAYLFGQQLV